MVVDQPPSFPSLGIAYIMQTLKANGYEVNLLDIDAHRYSKEEVTARIASSVVDIVAIGGLVTVWPYLTWLAPELRRLKPELEIILGGAVASSLKEKCYELDIDYLVIGEGEITIIELLDALKNGRSLEEVQGISFRNNGAVHFTEPRPLMSDLSDVPILDYDMFPMEKLLENSKRVVQIHAQRGCPNSCTFCFNCYRVVSRKVRYRPVERVVDEIEHVKKRYNVGLFAISGECITMNRAWLIAFCQEMIKRDLKIQYRVTSRVDTLDEEKLEWLKKSGCTLIAFGLESGSDKLLKIMKKNATAEQGLKAIHMARKYIRYVEGSIIMGYIGEDEATLRDTVGFCKAIGVLPFFFHAVPFPGTELYQMALAKGCIVDENAYLKQLDKSSIMSQQSMNLTDMPDEVARMKVAEAVIEVRRHYLWKSVFSGKIFGSVYNVLKARGIGHMAFVVKSMARSLFRP
jgi:radical SAM superfamily enzyme YgiQ (UPF0313 family)